MWQLLVVFQLLIVVINNDKGMGIDIHYYFDC